MQALKRLEAEKILNSADKVKKCETWLVEPDLSASEVEEVKDLDVLARNEFLTNLDKDAINLVVRDCATQERHDELPIAYRSIKTLLLK